MSKISLNRIIPLLTKQEHHSGVLGLLQEILVLQDKLDNLDRQSFYFQQGIHNHTAHLNALKRNYAQIVETVNNNSVDYFLEKIKGDEEKFKQICSRKIKHPIFVKVMVDAHINSEIAYLKMLIQAKGKFGTLKPLDDLIQDKNALLEIFSTHTF
jgi:superoxide dismutase